VFISTSAAEEEGAVSFEGVGASGPWEVVAMVARCVRCLSAGSGAGLCYRVRGVNG
jgi:hypothetical protein